MGRIMYRSTNRSSGLVNFKAALLKGQASDYGLYVPASIPKLTRKEIESFRSKNYHEIVFIITKKFLYNEIGAKDLKQLIKEAYNFEIPLEKVEENLHIMRLDRGPTASFKDFAARLMARLMNYFL